MENSSIQKNKIESNIDDNEDLGKNEDTDLKEKSKIDTNLSLNEEDIKEKEKKEFTEKNSKIYIIYGINC